jgi:hypothetical protein
VSVDPGRPNRPLYKKEEIFYYEEMDILVIGLRILRELESLHRGRRKINEKNHTLYRFEVLAHKKSAFLSKPTFRKKYGFESISNPDPQHRPERV